MLIFGYFIIPVMTFLYASQAPLINENFTGIANHHQQKYIFALWALITALYFLKASLTLFKSCQWHPKYLKPVSIIIFLGISLSPWIPYQDQYPHLETLHVLMAMGASILFLSLFVFFLAYLYTYDSILYRQLEPPFQLIISTLAILLIWSGHVSSLTELFMTNAMSIYLAYALNKIKKYNFTNVNK